METAIENVEEELRRGTTWSLIAAVGLIIIGAVVVGTPLVGALAAVMVFGAMAVVAGALELGYAWRMRAEHGAMWRFIGAIVSLLVGAFVLARPGVGMAALALWLGVMILVRGVTQLFVAYELRASHVWGWFVVDGVISLILGAFIVAAWPVGSVLFLGIWFGVSLIVDGVNRLVVAAMLRRALPPSTKAPPPLTAAHA
jgi:uncharacterized membrane protein HdeD (DUF308 family)